MEYKSIEIKKGIKFHYIKTDLFKTDLISVFLTRKLDRNTVTTNTLIPAVLTSGSVSMPTQKEINKEMENLYGAELDCGVEKNGDNHILKFYIESINNKYVLTNENLIEQVVNKLLEIIFEPVLENGAFKNEYIEKEKYKIRQLIEGKIDNKDKYATDRMIEEMYKNKLYGLYRYGYVEDLENITAESLYKAYNDLLMNAKIDIVISGDFELENIKNVIINNPNIKKLKERVPDFILNNKNNENEKKEEKTIIENLDVSQGKLVIGIDILDDIEKNRFAIGVYNTILGGSATSKLFQNVREKESLAYSIGSVFLKQKNNIIIKAGIEIPNYEKALTLIKKELNDMKNGIFSNEDIIQAKKFIIYGINAVNEDQEKMINYYISQELNGEMIDLEDYKKRIEEVTKEEIQEIANKMCINTVYFLRN